jgi:hypothetical protein
MALLMIWSWPVLVPPRLPERSGRVRKRRDDDASPLQPINLNRKLTVVMDVPVISHKLPAIGDVTADPKSP